MNVVDFECMGIGQTSVLRLSDILFMFSLWKKNSKTKPDN
jgi:hypothetical protein